MDLSKILSISGRPGLFEIINQTRGGVVALSLLDGKKVSIGQTQRVSTLSDISIYTEEGDELLLNVLQTVFKTTDGAPCEVDVKDDDALRGFMREMLPEHDEERVYTSDIRKVVKWYNLLLKSELIDMEKPPEVEKEAEEAGEAEEPKAEKEKPAKTAAPAKKKAPATKAPVQKTAPKAAGAAKTNKSSKKG